MRRGTRGCIGVGAALALWATGCQWMPRQRVDTSLDPRRVSRAPSHAPSASASALPVKAVSHAEVPLPEAPLRAISDAEALAAVAPTPTPTPAPTPTPLLDAAVAQAQEVQDAMIGALPPDPLSAPAPVLASEPASLPALAASPPRDETIIQTAAVGETKAPDGAPALKPPEPEAEPAPAPATPEEEWRSHFEALRALANAREAASDGEPWPLRAAVLDWLSEGGANQNDARTVFWSALIESLAQATSQADGGEPHPADNPALREAIEAMEGQLPLRVGALALCQKVQGFGQYELISESSCHAGQTVVLYCELEGLRYEPEGGEGGSLRSRLESTVVLRAGEGDRDRVLWSQSLGTAEDVCRRRRRDYYVNYRLTLPDATTLPPGTYRLQIQQRDANAGAEATAEIPLVISAAEASGS